MRGAFALIMLGLAGASGCIEPPPGVTQLPLEFGMSSDAISVRVRVEGQGPITQGQTLPVLIAVSNVSDGPVITAHVQMHLGRTSASYGWRPRVYGSVTYDDDANVYRLNEMAQMEALMADWSNGLLLPGETIECTVPVEVLEAGPLRSGCKLAYHAGTFETMAPTIYLQRERNGFDVTYAPSTPEQLRALAETREPPPGWRQVICHSDTEPLLLETQATLHVAPALFSPEEAMMRAELSTERFAYSEMEGGWVLEAPDAVVLVTPTKVHRYPGCTLSVWQFIERSEEEVYFWYLVDDETLHALFRPFDLLPEWGFHAHVPYDKAFELIQQAHQAGYLSQMSEFQFSPCISFEPLKPNVSD